MKKSIFRCVMAIAICFMFSQNALADLSVGLVAYYPFDRSAQDASGNSLNGAVINGGFRENRFGKANSALSGDVEVPDNDLLDFTSAFTLSAWLKVEAVPNQFGCWIGKDYTSSFASGIDAGNSLDCPGGSDVFRRMTVYIGDETSSFNDGPNFSCGTDTWYHVAVTFDDATDENKLYVNGVLSEKKGNSGWSSRMNIRWALGKTVGTRTILQDSSTMCAFMIVCFPIRKSYRYSTSSNPGKWAIALHLPLYP